MRPSLAAAVAGVVAGIAAWSAARADPHPMSAGANAVPAQKKVEVGIEREDLRIVVRERDVDVRADLVLANLGPAQELDVGFPCERPGNESIAQLDCRTRIAVRVDGKPVKVAMRRRPVVKGRPGGDGDWVWRMRFAPAQKTRLEVRYTAALRNDRYGNKPLAGMFAVHYRLITGAEWAGRIGRLDMRVELPREGIMAISPAGYRRSPGLVEWSLEGYSPSDDVIIIFDPMMQMIEHGICAKLAPLARKDPASPPLTERDVERALERASSVEEGERMSIMILGTAKLITPLPREFKRTRAHSLAVLRAKCLGQTPPSQLAEDVAGQLLSPVEKR